MTRNDRGLPVENDQTDVADDMGSGGGVSVAWSPDLDAYAAGTLDVAAIRCVLCRVAPCACPPFGTPEYLALMDRLHGRRSPVHRLPVTPAPVDTEQEAPQ